jgi:germination protein YpeB
VQNREPKGRGEKILTTTGLNYVRKILKGYVDADEIEYVGKTDGRLTTLNYRASGVVVQLSECGKLISMSAASEVGERTISTQEAEKTALEFLENAGFYGVSAVWVSYYYDNAYFNFACVHDGVIAMTDLIKVKVSLATGKVVGVDAQAHFYCCTERENLAPSVSEEEVLAGVPSSLQLEHIRLVLIPKGTSERLAYEVYGTIDGQKYFFYYDAETGKEIDVLIVIDSEQGLAM